MLWKLAFPFLFLFIYTFPSLLPILSPHLCKPNTTYLMFDLMVQNIYALTKTSFLAPSFQPNSCKTQLSLANSTHLSVVILLTFHPRAFATYSHEFEFRPDAPKIFTSRPKFHLRQFPFRPILAKHILSCVPIAKYHTPASILLTFKIFVSRPKFYFLQS